MIIAFAFLFTVLLVPLFGGQFWKLGAIKLERRELILASLIIQVLIISVVHGRLSESIASSLHLVSYALAIGFVWFNRNVIGMPIIVLGGLLNVLVIAANDGVMPARIGALETAGIPYDTGDFENSAPVEDAKLWFLGDVFAIPEGFPFSNVFSIGDVLLILGGAVTVHVVCGSKLVPLRWRAKVNLTDAAREAIDAEAEAAAEAELDEKAEAASPAPPKTPVSTEPVPVPAILAAPAAEQSDEQPDETDASDESEHHVGEQPDADQTHADQTVTDQPVAEQPLTPDVAPPVVVAEGPLGAKTLAAMFAQDNPPVVYRRDELHELANL